MQGMFEKVLSRLWEELGLEKAEFQAGAPVTLYIDSVDVVFREAQDRQTMSVETRVGKFTPHPSLARRELEKILKTCFAIAAARNTVVVLDDNGDADEPVLRVKGYYRYRNNDLGVLSSLVTDVLSSAETLQQITREFDGRQATAMMQTGAVGNYDSFVGNCVILKP